MGRIIGIQFFEQENVFAAAVMGMELRNDMAGMEVHRCQDGECAMAFILVIATPGAKGLGERRQVGGGALERLHALEAHRDD